MAEYVSQDNLSNSISTTSVEDPSLSVPVGQISSPPSLHSSQHLPTATTTTTTTEMNIPPPINTSQRIFPPPQTTTATTGGSVPTTTTTVVTTTNTQSPPPPPPPVVVPTATITSTQPPQTTVRCDALFVDKKGGYNVINLKNVTKPVPQDGEVIVRVVACGLNFDDLIARQGLSNDFPKPPFIMGFECSGYIDQIGRGVDNFVIGDRVLCFHNLGCGTKYLKISSRYVYHIPEQMNLQEAAAFPINYITAYILLFHHAHVKEGDMILIEMASGGVGIALTQLCKSIKDVTVIGTGSSSKHETMKRHGCDYCIDSLTQNITKEVLRITDGRGVDVIFNPLGGKSIEECYKIILPLGKLILFGEANKLKGEKKGMKSLGGEKSVKYTDLMKHNTTITGFDLYPLLEESQIFPPIIEALFTMYQDGIIKPRIDCAFHVSRTGDAERYLTERRNIGKVILVWDNDDLVMRSTDLEAAINSN